MVLVNIKSTDGAKAKGKRRTATSSYQRLARARQQQTGRRYAQIMGAQGEMKYFDSELTATALVASTDWTGTEFDPDTVPVASINTLFAPIRGTGINNRIGRAVNVMKVKVRGLISVAAQANQSAADSASYVRLALVQDMQTNTAQAQGEDVFRDPTTASSHVAATSFQSLANLGRFKVLKDLKINLGDPNAVFDGTNIEQQGIIRMFEMNVEFKTPVVVHFNATNGGTIADIVDNSWHIYCNCSSIALVPSIIYSARVAFKE